MGDTILDLGDFVGGLCIDFYGRLGGIVQVYKLSLRVWCSRCYLKLNGGPLDQVVEMQHVFRKQEVGQGR